jgi:hypothetical protein
LLRLREPPHYSDYSLPCNPPSLIEFC